MPYVVVWCSYRSKIVLLNEPYGLNLAHESELACHLSAEQDLASAFDIIIDCVRKPHST
jgi:hypothetical protein